MGERNNEFNKWVQKKLIGVFPADAKFLRIGFQAYNSAIGAVSLKNVKVYDALIKTGNVDGVKQIEIDDNILFPVSHGNL